MINKDNEAQIKSLQRRLFTIYIAVCIASSAYSGIPQLSQLPTSQTRSLYSDCQLKFRIALASNYSKQIEPCVRCLMALLIYIPSLILCIRNSLLCSICNFGYDIMLVD